MKPYEAREIRLIVAREDDGWWSVELPERDGAEFAKTFSRHSPHEALETAIPYIACLLE